MNETTAVPDTVGSGNTDSARCPQGDIPENGHERKKERSPEEIRNLVVRLNRIEGQIRGIRSMVEKGSYCPDILTQVAAANAALASFTKVLLDSHIRTCVVKDIRNGRDETIDELLSTLQKLMK